VAMQFVRRPVFVSDTEPARDMCRYTDHCEASGIPDVLGSKRHSDTCLLPEFPQENPWAAPQLGHCRSLSNPFPFIWHPQGEHEMHVSALVSV
jgi:hypothetical protein